MNSIIWRNSDVNRMFRTFGIACLYFESRIAPDQRYGQTKLESDAIHGFRYKDAVEERLMRTSISQKIILTEHGRMYEGGAKFSIPPVKLVDGVYVPVGVYERVFLGDVIVVKTKSIRDYDSLKKGFRDQLFAFDIKTILSVTSVDANGIEHEHLYGRDYTLQHGNYRVSIPFEKTDGTSVNVSLGKEYVDQNGLVPFEYENGGTEYLGISPTITATKRDGENVYDIDLSDTMPIASQINIVWNTEIQSGETVLDVPSDGNNYTVEFLCSPNYVVYNYSDKSRATEENNLPRTVMCVKRAYFNPVKPKMDDVDTHQMILDTPDAVFNEPLY
jgi:hypothetical protein